MAEPAINLQIKELLEDINKNLKTTDGEGRVITIAEAFKTIQGLSEKYADLEKRFAELDEKYRSRKWANLPGLEDEQKKFSLFKAVNAIMNKNWKGAELEEEVFRQTRAMSAGDDAAGGYLVPAQAVPELIELLRAEAVCIRMGARVIDNLMGSPVEFPKQTGGAVAYWVGENAAIPPSQATLGQLQMTPKSVTALVQLSNRLIRMSNPSAEQMVRQDVAIALGLAIDMAALRGTGTDDQPLGIANTPGINNVILGPNGGLADFDTFTDMEYELSVDNALRGKLGFVFHPAIRRRLKKLKIAQFSGDLSGEYILAPFSDAQLEAYLGYRFGMTTQIPVNLVKGTSTNCTELFFANWAELLIGQWAGFQILASDQAGTAFAANQTWIRIIADVDIGLRHTESFCLCSDAKIA
jgi:HK97 family phage major capsid protein